MTGSFEEVTEGIWHATHDLAMAGGIQFRTRSTLVRLADGSLWMHSPIPIDDVRAQEIAQLGEVSHIVAPNGFHDSFGADAKTRYPQATLWGSKGLQAQKSKLQVDQWLDQPAPWSDELPSLFIEGVPKGGEYVFFHPRTRTLIITDLLFQIRYPVNLRTQMVLWMAGASGGRLAQSKLWRALTKDRAAAGRSVQQMLEWDFERVILAHGDFVEGPDARERTRDALWWMLDAA